MHTIGPSEAVKQREKSSKTNEERAEDGSKFMLTESVPIEV